MSKELDAVIDKIHKLLALSSSSNPNEAALAAARAQELMFKYKISQLQLDASKKGDIGRTIFQLAYKPGKRSERWRGVLINSICNNNFCRVVLNPDLSVSIVGREEDITHVTWLYDTLANYLDRGARESRKQQGQHVDPWRWYLNFTTAAVGVIRARLVEMRRKNEEEAGTDCTALVRKEDAAVEIRFREMFPDTRANKRKDGFGADIGAQLAGVRAGNKAHLGRVIDNNRKGELE